jgi:hypothetical protein
MGARRRRADVVGSEQREEGVRRSLVLCPGTLRHQDDSTSASCASRAAARVHVNTWHIYDAALPFGGYKQSGWGREMGEEVLGNYLETKSVVIAL